MKNVAVSDRKCGRCGRIYQPDDFIRGKCVECGVAIGDTHENPVIAWSPGWWVGVAFIVGVFVLIAFLASVAQ